jgi:hypothetical protein
MCSAVDVAGSTPASESASPTGGRVVWLFFGCDAIFRVLISSPLKALSRDKALSLSGELSRDLIDCFRRLFEWFVCRTLDERRNVNQLVSLGR